MLEVTTRYCGEADPATGLCKLCADDCGGVWAHWKSEVAKMGGVWYSTTRETNCADPSAAGCTWRVVQEVKTVNATCANANVHKLVETRGQKCYSQCPQPTNTTSDCWIVSRKRSYRRFLDLYFAGSAREGGALLREGLWGRVSTRCNSIGRGGHCALYGTHLWPETKSQLANLSSLCLGGQLGIGSTYKVGCSVHVSHVQMTRMVKSAIVSLHPSPLSMSWTCSPRMACLANIWSLT